MGNGEPAVGGEIVLAWPTGEAGERAELLALHAGGAMRTPEQQARFAALCCKYGHPDMTLDDYAEYLRLHTRGAERTDDQENRYRELGARAPYGFDGADLTPETVEAAEEKRDRGEMSMADTIALDAAYRGSKPRDRSERRWMRGRSLVQRLFLRRRAPAMRAAPRHRPRTSRVARRLRARAPARRSEPAESDLAASPLGGAR
jgi:hypothetical protein